MEREFSCKIFPISNQKNPEKYGNLIIIRESYENINFKF